MVTSRVTLDLQATLEKLDGVAASKLERLVRDAIDLAQPSAVESKELDAHGWPKGYWEKFAGCFANEEWDVPEDNAPEPTPDW